MKGSFKKYFSILLALLILFSTAYTTGASYADSLADGMYSVEVHAKQAGNISEDSMSDGALNHDGLLEVIDGEWFLTLEFHTMYLEFGGSSMPGNVIEMKYYEEGNSSTGAEAKNVEVISRRDDAPPFEIPGQGPVKPVGKVRFPVAADSEGIFVNLFVDAMGGAVDAYFVYSVGEPILPSFTIDASAGPNGAIEPAGQTTVEQGSSLDYEFLPNDGYRVKDVLIDDQSVGARDSYTFNDVDANHTIAVSFEEDITYYSIEANAGPNGSIEPAGQTTVEQGASLDYEFLPDDGYRVKDVLIDGQSVGVRDSYTFNDINANHTIAVSFEEEAVSSSLPDGEYPVKTYLMKADNITESSGAADALVEDGLLKVTDGNWYLTAKFQTMYMQTPAGTFPGNASDIKYYTDGLGSTLAEADIISEETDAQGNKQLEVYMPLPVNSEGIYVNMYVDAMGKTVDAYIAFTIADEVLPSYTITATAGANGSIEPAGSTTVTSGEDQTYSISADAGYHIKEVLIDDLKIGAVDSYTFENVTADHTIMANFEKDVVEPVFYTITASAGANGSIEPTGQVTVKEGGSKVYSFTADDGYHIKNVLVDDESQGAITSYTFDDLKANHTIAVSFEKDAVESALYTITASAGANGSIEPAGQTTVKEGAVQLYSFIPDDGYRVKYILIDGKKKGSVGGYRFEDITADHMIKVVFEEGSADDAGADELDSVDESFTVRTRVKNAHDITKDSMAAEAIDDEGLIEVVGDNWYLTVEFQSIHFMGLLGNASEIKYYTSGLGSNLYDADILSYRTDENGTRQVRDVRIPVEAESEGVYVNMYADAMAREVDAYISFTPLEDRDAKPKEETKPDSKDEAKPADAASLLDPLAEREAALASGELRYIDVTLQHPFYNAVEKLSKMGVLNGTGDGMFTPYASVDRATLTTMLYRIAGEPQVAVVGSTFEDVAVDQWYSKAIGWAQNLGIVEGYSETMFGPLDVLTKEQIITILYRQQKPSLTGVVDMSLLNAHSDAAKVSAYAKEAVAWALTNGILTLDDFGRINPQEAVTRANMAVIVDKVLQLDK